MILDVEFWILDDEWLAVKYVGGFIFLDNVLIII